MSAGLESAEDVALRRTAREIATRCREARDGKGDDHTDCWAALVRTGFTDLRRGDEDGSPFATTTQTAIVVEELARVVCGAPLLGTLLATELLRLAGDKTVDDEALGITLDAELTGVGGVVVLDAAQPVVRAVGVTGRSVVVSGLTDARIGQDLSRPVATPADPVQTLGELDPAARAAFDELARVLIAAELFGSSAAVLEDAVRYAGDRVQFGVPIGTFQAVQHLCARAHVQVEAMRSALLFAAWSLDSGHADPAPSLVAKAYAARAGLGVAEAAVQVFGGVAITWEFPAHRHLRRALVDAALFGDADTSATTLFDMTEGRSDGFQ